MSGTGVFAQAPANSGIVVTDSSGTLRYRIGESEPLPLVKGQAIPIGARITTASNSHAVLTFPDGQIIAIGPQSRLLIRQYSYLPNNPAKSRVLVNLTDGSIFIGIGAIGRQDPSLIQIQVGAKVTPQSPERARGDNVGVIVLGTATLIQVAQGRVSLLVASTDQSYPLAAGERALVQSDGSVQLGSGRQIDETAGRSDDGKIMLERMESLRRYLPLGGPQIALLLTTPPADDAFDELATGSGTLPTMGTGAAAGGCGASCN
jgi:hypothetical protein